MIRITIQSKQNHTVVIIDGRVTESDLKEIQRVRKALKGDVSLDLRGLDGCAPVGIRLVRAWLDAGAQLEAATPFLEMILKDPSSSRPRIRKKNQPG
jgi:hypothetical protein